MIDPMERVRLAPARKAGAVLRYSRVETGGVGDDVVFVVLQNKAEKDHSDPGTLCLIIEGEVKGKGPGDILHLRGIVDVADEVEL